VFLNQHVYRCSDSNCREKEEQQLYAHPN